MKTWIHVLLAVGMLVTGSINTLTTAGADKVKSRNRSGAVASFDHPFSQVLCWFTGEAVCMIVFHLHQRCTTRETAVAPRRYSPLIFALPALLDTCASSAMYVGLTLTYASNFQMLRGSVVVFTGILSVLLLKRRMALYQWLGIFCVMIGVALVGADPFFCDRQEDPLEERNIVLGNALVIGAQILVAAQVCVEERFVAGYRIPALQVLGWEGIWGLVLLSIVLSVLYMVPQPAIFSPNGESREHFDDFVDAVVQV